MAVRGKTGMSQKTNMNTFKPQVMSRRPIAVIGFGTVGTSTACAFARQGVPVLCYDKDNNKREQLRRAVSPVNEPGLVEAIRDLRESARLVVTDTLRAAIEGSETVFLCVGASDEMVGKPDYSHLRRACVEISQMAPVGHPFTLIIRSPLYPGVYDELIAPAFRNSAEVAVVLNPPVLRQGDSLQDILQLRVNVLGAVNADHAKRAAEVFHTSKLAADICSIALAEFYSQVAGSFQALKSAFANEVAALCVNLRIPPVEMFELLGKDTLLNASPAFLKPGFSFSGIDMVREMAALSRQLERSNVPAPILGSIESSNKQAFQRVVQDIEKLGIQRLAVFGLSSRSNTDETRGSTALALAEALIGKKMEVRLFDPNIQFDRLHGVNWRHLLYRLPLAEQLLTTDLNQLLQWAEYLVLIHQPTKAQSELIVKSKIAVVNLSGVPLAA
jgi:GDP-mannose 6-dehydrogenase